MKNVLFLLLFAVSLNAQIVDSTVIKQVDSLVRASRDLTEQEEFDKALEVNTLAESIALKKMGLESAAYGNCIHNNGRILYFKGDYPNSEKRYLEAKAIRAQAPGVGKEHPDYITTVRDLGNLYAGLGAYLKAEPLFLEVKDILGSAHADYTSILSSLANLYADMANFEKAELYYLELNTLLEKAPGNSTPVTPETWSTSQLFTRIWAILKKPSRGFSKPKAFWKTCRTGASTSIMSIASTTSQTCIFIWANTKKPNRSTSK